LAKPDYYYLTSTGVDALRSGRLFVEFKEQLRQLGIETVIVIVHRRGLNALVWKAISQIKMA